MVLRIRKEERGNGMIEFLSVMFGIVLGRAIVRIVFDFLGI
jgi:hypothetical protein